MTPSGPWRIAVSGEQPLAADDQAAVPDHAATASQRLAAWATRHPWLLTWLTFVPLAVIRAGILAEADTFWQIRVGLYTISQHAIPAVDAYSWTMHGKPWTLNSWGFNVLVACAYRLAGLPGVAWLCAGLAMVAAGLLLVLARALGARPVVAGILLFLMSPLLTGWLTARPQLIDYIAMLVLVTLLRGICAGTHRGRSVAAAGILSVVWVNLHAASLLGVAVAGASAILLLPRRDTRTSGWWCLAGAAAALAGSFVNPYGFGLLGQTAQVQAESAGIMAEWAHFNPASPVQDLTITAGALALMIAARRRDAVLVAALGIAVATAIVAVRMMPFVAFIAVPVIAAWASNPASAAQRYARSRRVMFRRCGVAGFAAISVVALPSLTHIGLPNPDAYPGAVLGAIPPGCRLFTTDLLGDYVILERPDALVSVDTRNTLYGRERILADVATIQGQGKLASELTGAGCVLVPPASGLARRLRHDGAWERRAATTTAVLFVRR